MTKRMHGCDCHEECECTPEEKVQMLELSRKCIQTQLKTIDRRIVDLKEKGA